MATNREWDRAIGIAAIVVGILLIVGWWSFGWLIDVLGVALLVVGILILVKVIHGSQTMGIVFLVIGLVLVVGIFGIPSAIKEIIDIVAGVLLIVFGILRLK